MSNKDDNNIFLKSLAGVEPLKKNNKITKSIPKPIELNTLRTIIKETESDKIYEKTKNVIKQLSYHKQAIENDITIVPDCGMGPGMNVTMALLAMEQFDTPEDIFIWDGGLPQNPIPAPENNSR